MLMEREWTVCPRPDCQAKNKGETNQAEFKNMTTFPVAALGILFREVITKF